MIRTPENKLHRLGQAAQFDLACACGDGDKRSRSDDGTWIYPAVLPDGRRVFLFKILQAGGCERDCAYCAERSGGPAGPTSFTPDDLAGRFDELQRAGRVGGLFLSSAIQDSSVKAMDRMLATVELVRRKHQFRGFVHLKILPGAEEPQILRAMELADRVSVNLEAPTPESLLRIAPRKELDSQLLRVVRTIGANLDRPGVRARSQTTQFVVGAGDETDRQILDTLWRCYRELRLARGYFSAFQPVAGTPLEDRPPASLDREHRLYQSDFLLRKYGFTFEEIVFGREGNLSLDTDPKSAWVSLHPELFPVEINTASQPLLLRVPGIGPDSASRILRFRRTDRIRNVENLQSLSRRWRTAAPYLLLDGRRATGQRVLF